MPEDSLVLMRGALEVADGWNMVSVPLTVSEYSTTRVYSTALGSAFIYQGSYVAQSMLTNGIGYWVKFSGAQTIPMDGDFRGSQNINVQAGWNMIGSISLPVAISSISSSPPGIVASQFFGYNGSYYNATSIEPGQAYWAKVNQNGQFTLMSSSNVSGSNRIRIVPTRELPPPPPSGGESTAEEETPKQRVPESFALEQNYPNPFNPLTVIRYQLPNVGRDAVSTTGGRLSESSYKVTLRIYNVLGQVVATLIDGVQDAGYKQVEWNAVNIASGVYFYRLDATSITDQQTFSKVSKMMIVR